MFTTEYGLKEKVQAGFPNQHKFGSKVLWLMLINGIRKFLFGLDFALFFFLSEKHIYHKIWTYCSDQNLEGKNQLEFEK